MFQPLDRLAEIALQVRNDYGMRHTASCNSNKDKRTRPYGKCACSCFVDQQKKHRIELGDDIDEIIRDVRHFVGHIE